jgi:hypothetical protein
LRLKFELQISLTVSLVQSHPVASPSPLKDIWVANWLTLQAMELRSDWRIRTLSGYLPKVTIAGII